MVELAASLSEEMPPGQVARTLARLGIQLDRATIRSYSRLPLPPNATLRLFGLPVPVSILRLSSEAGSSVISVLDQTTLSRISPSGATVQKWDQE
ncbi:MAG: hypothetical protein AB7S61_00325 [Methanoregulaceae archaeon]